MEFDSASYLQRIKGFTKKVKNHFLDLNLDSLESDGEEEVSKVDDEGLWVEKLFSPIHKDQPVKDVASALPPAIIILFDRAKVDESRAPEGA